MQFVATPRFRIAACNRTSLATLGLAFPLLVGLGSVLLEPTTWLWTFALMLAILAITIGHMFRASVTLEPEAVRVGAGMFRTRVAYADILSVSMHAEAPHPGWRTFGIGMPGFRLGWFSGEHLRRQFVATGRSGKTLRLNLRRGFDVVVEVEDPGELEAALRQRLQLQRDGQGVNDTSNEM